MGVGGLDVSQREAGGGERVRTGGREVIWGCVSWSNCCLKNEEHERAGVAWSGTVANRGAWLFRVGTAGGEGFQCVGFFD